MSQPRARGAVSNPPKARGAVSNPKPRFDTLDTVAIDDGWSTPEGEAEALAELPPDPRTEIALQPAKSIIARNASPDIPFGQSINPYRGCEHGCIYCFARPGHAFLGLSPGLDFETKIIARPNAAQLLDAELRKPGYVCEHLAVGTNTDPYQPAENKLGIFRDCLKVLAAFNQPLSITTKSHLVTRDLDILVPMAKKGLVSVAISVTTLDRDIAREMEPRAPVPMKRIEAIRTLSAAGIPTTIMVAPVVPVLTDHEMERIMTAGREAGALDAAYILMRLPYEVKDLFVEWIESRYPAKARHVLSLVRQQRDGQLNDATWAVRMKGQGEFARVLATRFSMARRRLGFPGKSGRLNTTLFAPPPKAGDQLRLAL
ncbi:MAG TPA: PA0069 family radical SAM protein [Magnetospirillaceae bacterium]